MTAGKKNRSIPPSLDYFPQAERSDSVESTGTRRSSWGKGRGEEEATLGSVKSCWKNWSLYARAKKRKDQRGGNEGKGRGNLYLIGKR